MIIGIKKPSGITSHDVVDKVRKITGERRVGHGGTLDPFADGVLVIGISRESTKNLGDVLKNSEKEYIATVELGKTSTTGDPEGEIKETVKRTDVLALGKKDVEKILENFRGEIEQKPHAFSAIKINGTPAYKMSRRGEKVDLEKRKIYIRSLEILDFDPPILKIKAVVSSGTYIRSLVEDIGETLGVGAYTKSLTRTRVGNFKLEDCKTLDELKKGL